MQKVKQKLTKHPCNRRDSCTLLYWRPKILKNLVEAAVTENTFNWICHFVYQQGSFLWICWVSHTHLASDHQRIQVDFNFSNFVEVTKHLPSIMIHLSGNSGARYVTTCLMYKCLWWNRVALSLLQSSRSVADIYLGWLMVLRLHAHCSCDHHHEVLYNYL